MPGKILTFRELAIFYQLISNEKADLRHRALYPSFVSLLESVFTVPISNKQCHGSYVSFSKKFLDFSKTQFGRQSLKNYGIGVQTFLFAFKHYQANLVRKIVASARDPELPEITGNSIEGFLKNSEVVTRVSENMQLPTEAVHEAVPEGNTVLFRRRGTQRIPRSVGPAQRPPGSVAVSDVELESIPLLIL